MDSNRSIQAILQVIAVAILMVGALTFVVFSPFFDPTPPLNPTVTAALLAFEAVLYLFFCIGFFKRIDIIDALFITVVTTVLRSLINAAAAYLAINVGLNHWLANASGVPVTLDTNELWLSLWYGNPLVAFFQVAILGSALVPTISLAFPRFTGDLKETESDDTEPKPDFSSSSRSGIQKAIGSGGYLHCYSYSELHDFIRKLPDTIGFALATNEGLIVTSDSRQIPFSLEAAVPRLQTGVSLMAEHQKRSGMPSKELWQFSGDYTQIMLTIDPVFFLVIFLKPNASLQEVMPRFNAIKSAAERFLTERHAPIMPQPEEE
jgi:hypothetical protein